jgi:hypothetical protein
MPITLTPSSSPRMVAALITLLIPGAGPPPTRIAIFLCWLVMVDLQSAPRRSSSGLHRSPRVTAVCSSAASEPVRRSANRGVVRLAEVLVRNLNSHEPDASESPGKPRRVLHRVPADETPDPVSLCAHVLLLPLEPARRGVPSSPSRLSREPGTSHDRPTATRDAGVDAGLSRPLFAVSCCSTAVWSMKTAE